ncbi:hypothetical protein AGMMS49921_02860 [Endomicrobiia bacterium]|nr:hypothetical protein AGMMS49921_02860 [Endomicrobiia bacterium]
MAILEVQIGPMCMRFYRLFDYLIKLCTIKASSKKKGVIKALVVKYQDIASYKTVKAFP